jgi:hypothetical protein
VNFFTHLPPAAHLSTIELIYSKNLRKADIDELRNFIQSTDLGSYLPLESKNDLDDFVHHLTESMLACLSQLAPEKKNTKVNKYWFDREVQNARRTHITIYRYTLGKAPNRNCVQLKFQTF